MTTVDILKYKKYGSIKRAVLKHASMYNHVVF